MVSGRVRGNEWVCAGSDTSRDTSRDTSSATAVVTVLMHSLTISHKPWQLELLLRGNETRSPQTPNDVPGDPLRFPADLQEKRALPAPFTTYTTMKIVQPNTQIKLTNVSIVRYRKGGKRFEIACYKNKVMEWRNGVEKDLSEVMQIDNVFLNVSKGQAANKDDLVKSFKTEDRNAIILEILKKGELQVGEKERSTMLEGMYRDIATTVAEKCVNPETKRPYTVTMIEKAMADLHLSVNPSRSAKSQALDVIKQLLEKKTIPIARAQMRIRIIVPSKDGKRIKDKLMTMIASKEDEDLDENYEWTCLIDPGQFRPINELLQSETKGKGQLEMLSLTETKQGDEVF